MVNQDQLPTAPADSSVKHVVIHVPKRVVPKKKVDVPYYQKYSNTDNLDIHSDLYHSIAEQPVKPNTTTLYAKINKNAEEKYQVLQRTDHNGSFYNFVFLLLLTLLFFLAYLRKHFGKYLLQIIGSVVNAQLSNRLFRDKSAMLDKVDYQLTLSFIVISSIFSFYAIQILNLSMHGTNDYVVFLGCIVLWTSYSLYNNLSTRLMGFIMQRKNEFEEYQYNTFLYHKVLGIIILPITIMMLYLPDTLKIYPLVIGFGIIIILFIMRILRCFVLIVRKDILLFYAISYLCTIEVLPMLLLSKVAISFTR